MILHIDTTNKDQVFVQLEKDGKVIEKLSEENEYGSQVLLPLLAKLLKKQKISYKDLEEIKVNTGPGSFTGVRVGVSVANGLGFSLNIPVNGKKMETEVNYSN